MSKSQERYYIQQGNTFFNSGDYIEAIKYYDEVIKIYPTAHSAYSQKGIALSALGKHAEAIECYDNAIRRQQHSVAYYEESVPYYLKGMSISALGDKVGAIKCYDQAIQINPGEAVAYYLKGKALSFLDKHAEAIECYDQAIQINPNDSDFYKGKIDTCGLIIEKNPNDAVAYYLKGKALSFLDKHAEAIECYDQAIHLDPQDVDFYKGKRDTYSLIIEKNLNDAEAYYGQGMTFVDLKKNDEASVAFLKAAYIWDKTQDYARCIDACDREIEINPKNAVAYSNKGTSLSALGKHAKAIECYDQAIQINPKDAFIYYNKGNALSALGDKEGAIKCYDQAIQINPQNSDAYSNKAVSLSALGDKVGAIKCYDQAIQINPKDAVTYYNKGNALSALGKHAEAIECYDAAIRLDPQNVDFYEGKIDTYGLIIEQNPNDVEAYNLQGNSLSTLGDKVGAIKCYDQAIQINPKDAVTYYNKGVALSALEDKAGAIKCYDQAIQINPKDAVTYYNKGVALSALGDEAGAIKCYDQAIQINPKDAVTYYNKGKALSALGKHAEAIECYDEAIRLDPQDIDCYKGKIDAYYLITKKNPNDAEAYYDQGMTFVDLQNHDEASDAFLKAADIFYKTQDYTRCIDACDRAEVIAIDLKNTCAFYNLQGNSLSALGKNGEAIKCYDKAIKINPQHAITYNDSTQYHAHTLLGHAAQNNQWDIVKWLVDQKKVDVNVEMDNGDTLLILAFRNNSTVNVAKLLIDNGAHINHTSIIDSIMELYTKHDLTTTFAQAIYFNVIAHYKESGIQAFLESIEVITPQYAEHIERILKIAETDYYSNISEQFGGGKNPASITLQFLQQEPLDSQLESELGSVLSLQQLCMRVISKNPQKYFPHFKALNTIITPDEDAVWLFEHERRINNKEVFWDRMEDDDGKKHYYDDVNDYYCYDRERDYYYDAYAYDDY